MKRLLDVVVAGLAPMVSAPLQVLLYGLIRRWLGHPVLFRQVRPGLVGEPFTLVEFGTVLDVDPERGLVTDADRLTPLGAKPRSSSVDELPTLWNVMRGDMSLVGLRPQLVRYLDRYTPEQRRRHYVRPGTTGLAQVRGRNPLDSESRLFADIEYVDRFLFALDTMIPGRPSFSYCVAAGSRRRDTPQ